MADENMEDILEEFGSESAIEAAKRDRLVEVDTSQKSDLNIKDYPKVQREIDLHGHTVPEAIRAMLNFVEYSIKQRVRTVRIITGRGLHSENFKAVLPDMVEKELVTLRRAKQVLEYKREKDRGSFVVYLIS